MSIALKATETQVSDTIVRVESLNCLLVVTCWKIAGLLALLSVVFFYVSSLFHMLFRVRYGTGLYDLLIFAFLHFHALMWLLVFCVPFSRCYVVVCTVVCDCGISWYELSSDQGLDCWTGMKVSKGAKIRNRYNQVPHLTQDTYGKVTNSQWTPQTRAKRSALSYGSGNINPVVQALTLGQSKNIDSVLSFGYYGPIVIKNIETGV